MAPCFRNDVGSFVGFVVQQLQKLKDIVSASGPYFRGIAKIMLRKDSKSRGYFSISPAGTMITTG